MRMFFQKIGASVFRVLRKIPITRELLNETRAIDLLDEICAAHSFLWTRTGQNGIVLSRLKHTTEILHEEFEGVDLVDAILLVSKKYPRKRGK